jgi:hypothetical protein
VDVANNNSIFIYKVSSSIRFVPRHTNGFHSTNVVTILSFAIYFKDTYCICNQPYAIIEIKDSQSQAEPILLRKKSVGRPQHYFQIATTIIIHFDLIGEGRSPVSRQNGHQVALNWIGRKLEISQSLPNLLPQTPG